MTAESATVALGAPSIGAFRAPPLALAGGSLIFLIFLVVFFLAVVLGYYTLKGSGIAQTPYRHDDGPPESPSELAHDVTQDVRNWGRGTSTHHWRHRPAASREPVDQDVAEALRKWRHGSGRHQQLDPPVGPADHVHGEGARATVMIYLDLASAPCRNAWALLAGLVNDQPMRVAVRHLPLADVHKLALPAAETLEAAGAQGQFFELLDQLARGFSNERDLLNIATGLVTDSERLELEVNAGRYRGIVIDHIHQATRSGAHAVPELYVDGAHYAGALNTDSLTRALA
jgi:hypothetical protein